MRRILLAMTAVLTLLLAPVALAADHGRSADRVPEGAAHADHDNETAAHAEHENESADLNETRGDGHGDGHDRAKFNDTAFKEKARTLREQFVQDVKDLVAGCRASREAARANNTTGDHDGVRSWANCLSNGMRALQISHHAEMKELRQERRAARDADEGAKPTSS